MIKLKYNDNGTTVTREFKTMAEALHYATLNGIKTFKIANS